MNERIKELAEQAELKANQGDHIDVKIMMEKFAELIVRECADIAQDFVTVENNKLGEHVHISLWKLQDTLKEHFGVE